MGSMGAIAAQAAIEGKADYAVMLDDMGDGSLVLSQFSEASGLTERVVIEWADMLAKVEALRPRYG